MYRIIDLQGDYGFELTKQKYKTKKDIIKELAEFHYYDFDEAGYPDIYKYLKSLKTEKKQLEFLLNFGMWDIQKVRS